MEPKNESLGCFSYLSVRFTGGRGDAYSFCECMIYLFSSDNLSVLSLKLT